MGFNIQTQDYSVAAQQGYSFNLILPDGTESDAKLTVIGDMSPEVQNYSKKMYKELNLKMKQAKGKGKEFDPTLEEMEDDAVRGALLRLVGWEGITEGEGKDEKPVKFSKEKAEEILRQHSWIREQIYKEAAEVSNFTPKKT